MRQRRIRRGGLLLGLVLLALIVYALVSLLSLQERRATEEQARRELEQQVEAQKSENAALEYAIAHSEDEDTLMGIARSKLGLVKPGERIFYDINT